MDDWKRGVQDAAKHRAVKQLEGYDAFKNMVSVAHLRPYHAPNLKDHSGPAPPAFAFTPEGVHGGPGATVGMDVHSHPLIWSIGPFIWFTHWSIVPFIWFAHWSIGPFIWFTHWSIGPFTHHS